MSPTCRMLLAATLFGCALPGTPAFADEAPSAADAAAGDGPRESPIGLYIIPWRGSAPSPQMDRPARLLDQREAPVDPLQFSRYIEYYEALSRHRAAREASAN